MQIKMNLPELTIEKIDALGISKGGLRRSAIVTMAVEEMIQSEYRRTKLKILQFDTEREENREK